MVYICNDKTKFRVLKSVFIISLIVFFAVVYMLFTASPFLEYELSSNPYIPLGNILTWAGLTSLPISIYTGISSIGKPETVFNRILKLIILFAMVLAILWMPVSYFLADNLAANFEAQEGFRGSTRAASCFWNYNYLVVGLPLLVLFTYWLSCLVTFFRKSHTK